ncbi:MAG: hypothetical protein QXD04_05560, partial [Candidatus Bathyarchaeia archaeon]
RDVRARRKAEELKRRLRDGSEVETVTVAEWMGEPIEVLLYKPKPKAEEVKEAAQPQAAPEAPGDIQSRLAAAFDGYIFDKDDNGLITNSRGTLIYAAPNATPAHIINQFYLNAVRAVIQDPWHSRTLSWDHLEALKRGNAKYGVTQTTDGGQLAINIEEIEGAFKVLGDKELKVYQGKGDYYDRLIVFENKAGEAIGLTGEWFQPQHAGKEFWLF